MPLSSRSLSVLSIVGLLLLAIVASADDTPLVFVHDASTSSIYKLTGSGATPVQIKTGITSSVIGAYKGWVYAVKSTALTTTLTEHRVIRFAQDGTLEEELPIATSTGQIRGISFSDGYLIVNINKQIIQYGLNGLFATLISAPSAVPSGLATGDDYFYFATDEVLKVFAADKKNGETRTIYTPSDSPTVLTVTVVDDKVIVAKSTTIKKMDDDGSDVTDITDGKSYTAISALAAYNDDTFLLADSTVGAVYLVSVDDGSRSTYTNQITTPDGLAADVASTPDLSASSVASPSAFVVGIVLSFALLLALF